MNYQVVNWDLSRVLKDDLRAVPVRAYNIISDKEDLEHDRGRKHYMPWFVSGRNSASNVGIAHIFSHIYNVVQHLDSQDRYAFVKLDINLFLKFLQVH